MLSTLAVSLPSWAACRWICRRLPSVGQRLACAVWSNATTPALPYGTSIPQKHIMSRMRSYVSLRMPNFAGAGAAIEYISCSKLSDALSSKPYHTTLRPAYERAFSMEQSWRTQSEPSVLRGALDIVPDRVASSTIVLGPTIAVGHVTVQPGTIPSVSGVPDAAVAARAVLVESSRAERRSSPCGRRCGAVRNLDYCYSTRARAGVDGRPADAATPRGGKCSGPSRHAASRRAFRAGLRRRHIREACAENSAESFRSDLFGAVTGGWNPL